MYEIILCFSPGVVENLSPRGVAVRQPGVAVAVCARPVGQDSKALFDQLSDTTGSALCCAFWRNRRYMLCHVTV